MPKIIGKIYNNMHNIILLNITFHKTLSVSKTPPFYNSEKKLKLVYEINKIFYMLIIILKKEEVDT